MNWKQSAAQAVAIGLLLGGFAGCVGGTQPTVTVPTLSPVIPAGELAGRLTEVLQKNLPNGAVVECVAKAVLAERQKGALQDVDLDNYVRNVVTDRMRTALVRIQDAGTCPSS